ncbi:hypothetical protein LMH73_014440 [Vibrio splendidus]|nr:hypothetical protein [Vibrio splendidus]MCC4882507.1 hypothetical protein [Vibrio splendidus]
MNDYGFLASECGVNLKNQVLHSAAGYYIGTLEDGMPYSRESLEYFPSQEEAETALKTNRWTQRIQP